MSYVASDREEASLMQPDLGLMEPYQMAISRHYENMIAANLAAERASEPFMTLEVTWCG